LALQSPKPLAQTPDWQLPAEHTAVTCVVEHAEAQAPQLFTSVCGSTQNAPQFVSPDGQLYWHAPPVQICPERQTLAQLPQLARSVVRFTQVPLQAVRPLWQLSEQTPLEHTSPAGQTVEQLPQWVLSVSRLAQVELHAVSPVGQLTEQTPAEQTSPEPQAEPAVTPVHAPEAPQYARSVIGSTQAPLQSTRPLWQLSVQAPLVQTSPAPQAVPAAVPVHTPDAPQCARSVAGSTQEPPQFTCALWQLTAQAPLLQTSPDAQAVPALEPVHAPDAPQCRRSLFGSTQVPLQATIPLAQLSAQEPPLQTSPEAQVVPAFVPEQSPAAPQCDRSVIGSTHAPPQRALPL
jgi:hypothetical protein